MGGKPRKQNRPNDGETVVKRKRGRGTSKTPVIGVKERNTGKVHAVVANPNKDGKQLSGKQLFNFLNMICKDDTVVMTDQFAGYDILDRTNDKKLHALQSGPLGDIFALGDGIHTKWY